MKVKLCTQTLGKRTASFLQIVCTDPQAQFYEPGAIQTSQVIEKLDCVFDDCNGSLERRPDKPRRRTSRRQASTSSAGVWQRKLQAVKISQNQVNAEVESM